jgi:hypothetical protein
MATITHVDFNPFASGKKQFSFDDALSAEGVTGRLADVARSIYQQESGSGANTRTSNAGAVGGMQIIPATFRRVADKDWRIDDPEHNLRAGLRYLKQLEPLAGGRPELIAAGYYGGEGAIPLAAQGRSLRDPINPGAPDTIEYGRQVASRLSRPKESNIVPVDFNPFADDTPSFADVKSEKANPPQRFSQRFGEEISNTIPVQVGSGLLRGVKDVVDTGAELLASGYDKLRGNSITNLVTGGEADRVRRMNAAGKAEYEAGLPQGSDADTVVSRIGSGAGRIGGNIIGTLPLTSAAGAGLAASGATRLGNALSSAGMTTGAKVLPGAANAAKDLAIRSVGGAGAGAISTGAVDPASVGTGAMIGAALPPALKVVGAGANLLGSGARSVYQAVSEKGARQAAMQKIAEASGDVPNTISAINTYYPKGAETIPVSAAAITQNPALARMEQGSRLRATQPWYEFDRKQGQAVYDNVLRATRDADELTKRIGQRAENWRDAWQKADDKVKPKLWQWGIERLRIDLDQAAKSAEAIKPGVRNVIDKLRSQIDELGQGFSPSHLQQVRAELNGRIKPLSPSAYESAQRDTPAIISLKKELDRILNESTKGQWQKVIEGYAKDSVAVHEAKSADRVRASFVDKDTGRLLAADPTDSFAKITGSGLSRSMNAAREPRTKNLLLSPAAEQQLSATVEALKRQGIVQDVKRSASSGGGSDTVSNALASVGDNLATRNFIRGIVDQVRKSGTAKTDEQIAKLLSDPDELVKAFGKMNPQKQNAFVRALESQTIYRTVPVLAANR